MTIRERLKLRPAFYDETNQLSCRVPWLDDRKSENYAFSFLSHSPYTSIKVNSLLHEREALHEINQLHQNR